MPEPAAGEGDFRLAKMTYDRPGKSPRAADAGRLASRGPRRAQAPSGVNGQRPTSPQSFSGRQRRLAKQKGPPPTANAALGREISAQGLKIAWLVEQLIRRLAVTAHPWSSLCREPPKSGRLVGCVGAVEPSFHWGLDLHRHRRAAVRGRGVATGLLALTFSRPNFARTSTSARSPSGGREACWHPEGLPT